MVLLNGKRLSEEILEKIEKEISRKRLKLGLVVVQVGKNSVSRIFINQKKQACQKVGISFKLFEFPTKIKKSALKKEIEKICKDPKNSGIIIQLPLPKRFLPEDFLNLIPREKDVDVLSENSLGSFYQGFLKILPPTVQGILYLLKKYRIGLKGKDIAIVGAGRLVGFPLAIQLLKEKATVSVINEFTRDAEFFTKKADILVSGVGKPKLIKENMIKKGAVIIDAGTSLKTKKLVGDVDFYSVSKKVSYITPVPGGLGPMTVACLLENLTKINN